jgi:GT2 family glycosyltransferase
MSSISFAHTPSLDLSIVMVSHSTAAQTAEAIRSVVTAFNSCKSRPAFELLVVDSKSTDNSVAVITKTIASLKKTSSAAKISLIKLDKNIGFAAANARGLEVSRGQSILFLNPDTTVSATAADRLWRTYRRGGWDALTTQLRFPSGDPQPQGGDLPTLFSVFVQWYNLDSLPLLEHILPSAQWTRAKHAHIRERTNARPYQLGWIAGTVLMTSRKTIDAIGSFDTTIFLYGEDMEWCVRANQHHLKVGLEPRAMVTHHQAASSSRQRSLSGELEGLLYIWKKHRPKAEFSFLKFILMSSSMLRAFVFDTIGRDSARAAVYRNLAKIAQQHEYHSAASLQSSTDS